jgi:hypothetical protein
MRLVQARCTSSRQGRTRTGLQADTRHSIATESNHYVQVEQPDLAIDVVEALRNHAFWR